LVVSDEWSYRWITLIMLGAIDGVIDRTSDRTSDMDGVILLIKLILMIN